MVTAALIALAISHTACLALGAWGHYMLGARVANPAPPLRTEVQSKFGSPRPPPGSKPP